MKNKRLILFILLSIVITADIMAQSVPVLTAPVNKSTMQKAVNIKLEWEALPGNPIYTVQYSTDSAFTPSNIAGSVSVSGSSITIARLNNDNIYYWRVRTNQANAAWSEVWNFKTTPLPVIPVTYTPANDAINMEKNQLFNWSRNEVNKSFLLQISLNSSFLGTSMNYVSTDTFFVAPGLVNNTDYFWRVKALNIDNTESGWSTVNHFKTRLHTPANLLPAGGIINADTAGTFSWVSADAPVTFHFQLSVDSLFGRGTVLIDSILTNDSIKFSSLNFNTKYFWRLYSYNAAGDSSLWTDAQSFTTKLKYPVIVSSKDSVINSDTTVSFVWHNITGAEKYAVQLAEDTLFTRLIVNNSVSDTSYIFRNLDFNKSYFLRIQSYNNAGNVSDWTKIFFRTRLANIVLYSPGDSAVNISPKTIFRWNKIAGADRYNLLAGYDSLFTKAFIDTVISDTSYTASLAYDTTYYWRVTGFNNQGDSSHVSETFRFKTRPPVLFSADSVNIKINLSQYRSDTLSVISVSNVGNKAFEIDSIKASPDSVFSISKSSAVIQPDKEDTFSIKFSTAKADTGLNNGYIYFIRNNFPSNDTLKVKLGLYLEKSVPSFSDSSLAYDSTDATVKAVRKITFRNWGGNIPLRIDSLKITGADTTAFFFQTKVKTPVSIKANDSVSYYIVFDPQKLGEHEASLYIETNSYPDSLFEFPLTGTGRGGELSTTTLARVSELSDSLFEAFSDNNKRVTFKNNGNAPIDIYIKFAQNKFKVGNDFLKSFTVKNGDSVSLDIKYMIPDFRKSEKDTMRIIHNGFGRDTLLVYLEGTYDSLASAGKIQSELRLNSNTFSTSDKVINENTPLNFTLNPDMLTDYSHLEFRVNYYTGGDGSRISAENDGSYNYIIPKSLTDKRGLLISGQLIARDKNNKIIDSTIVFPWVNAQVILKDYRTVEVNVPKSVPADKAENAKTKWIMFGFPFDEVVADSVFKILGGIKNMKDAEWIIYQYDLAAADSFSLFNGYSFTPNKAYFIAQALQDTFKISYTYKENLRTRKLTDTLLTTPGTNWKTVSSPYLFDVEVDPSVMLRYWDTNNKTYKMTNIMKPGIGYFVEPSVAELKLITYGQYDPLYYPKALANIGWHIKLIVSNENGQKKENLFTVESSNNVAKINGNLPYEYAVSPDLEKGLEFYTIGDVLTSSEATIHRGNNGSVFNVVIKSSKDDYINIEPEIGGSIPAEFSYSLYNEETRSVISLPDNKFFVQKGKEYKCKLIVGTNTYITKTLSDLSKQIPESFALSQNYPNPFNPSTTIDYQVPENTFVTIKVYDILGEETATLVNEQQSPGYYKVNFNAGNYASGVYFFRLTAGRFTQVRKMVLIK
jgi:hypothetical protein